MRWGKIGSAAAELAALIATVFAVSYAIVKKQGHAWLQAIRDYENARADAAREQAGLAREQIRRARQVCHRSRPHPQDRAFHRLPRPRRHPRPGTASCPPRNPGRCRHAITGIAGDAGWRFLGAAG